MNVKKDKIEIFPIDISHDLPLPFANEGIEAGFPSPAQDYMDFAIDLNHELVSNPQSTFYGRVRGNSMKDAQVFDGDILVIDKALEPKDGDMAVCFLDGEFTLKYVRIQTDEIYLVPANEAYEPIRVLPEDNFIIWGVVTYCIHRCTNRESRVK